MACMGRETRRRKKRRICHAALVDVEEQVHSEWTRLGLWTLTRTAVQSDPARSWSRSNFPAKLHLILSPSV